MEGGSLPYGLASQIQIRENQRCRCHSRLQRTAGKRGLDGIEIEEALVQSCVKNFGLLLASSTTPATSEFWVFGF